MTGGPEVLVQVVKKWGMARLFAFVNGTFRIPEGQRSLFSPTLYGGVYACAYRVLSQINHGAGQSIADACNMRKLQEQELATYMRTTVVPSLSDKHGAALFDEFKKRWEDHKVLTDWVRAVFGGVLDSDANRASSSLARPGTVSAGVAGSGGATSTMLDTLTSASIKLFKKHAFDAKKESIGDNILVRTRPTGGAGW